MKITNTILYALVLNIGIAVSGVAFAGCNASNCPAGGGGSDCIAGFCANAEATTAADMANDNGKKH